jgi:hypothetical protein
VKRTALEEIRANLYRSLSTDFGHAGIAATWSLSGQADVGKAVLDKREQRSRSFPLRGPTPYRVAVYADPSGRRLLAVRDGLLCPSVIRRRHE